MKKKNKKKISSSFTITTYFEEPRLEDITTGWDELQRILIEEEASHEADRHNDEEFYQNQ